MAKRTRAELIAAINTLITANNNNEITGDDLNGLLEDVVDSVMIFNTDGSIIALSEYDATKVYNTGVAVIRDGVIYQSLVDNNVAPFDINNWSKITVATGSIDTFEPWDNAASYEVGDFVVFQQKIYQALSANQGQSPLLVANNPWQEISAEGTIDQYRRFVNYKQGKYLKNDGQLYEVLVDFFSPTSINTAIVQGKLRPLQYVPLAGTDKMNGSIKYDPTNYAGNIIGFDNAAWVGHLLIDKGGRKVLLVGEERANNNYPRIGHTGKNITISNSSEPFVDSLGNLSGEGNVYIGTAINGAKIEILNDYTRVIGLGDIVGYNLIGGKLFFAGLMNNNDIEDSDHSVLLGRIENNYFLGGDNTVRFIGNIRECTIELSLHGVGVLASSVLSSDVFVFGKLINSNISSECFFYGKNENITAGMPATFFNCKDVILPASWLLEDCIFHNISFVDLGNRERVNTVSGRPMEVFDNVSFFDTTNKIVSLRSPLVLKQSGEVELPDSPGRLLHRDGLKSWISDSVYYLNFKANNVPVATGSTTGVVVFNNTNSDFIRIKGEVLIEDENGDVTIFDVNFIRRHVALMAGVNTLYSIAPTVNNLNLTVGEMEDICKIIKITNSTEDCLVSFTTPSASNFNGSTSYNIRFEFKISL